MVQNQNSFPDKMDSPNAQGSTIVVPAKNKAPPLESGKATKIGGQWNLNQ